MGIESFTAKQSTSAAASTGAKKSAGPPAISLSNLKRLPE
jgi:hypothetical protein